MGKNDIYLIDATIQEYWKQKADLSNIGQVFDYFAIEQILKQYDMSELDYDAGIIDGGNDGGIDGLFFLINGIPINDMSKFEIPKGKCSFEMYIITCRHDDGFKQPVLNSVISTINELFDFSKSDSQLINPYNEALLQLRNQLMHIFPKILCNLFSSQVTFVFATRGNTLEIANNIRSKSEQIKTILNDHFSNTEVTFSFLGSAELLNLYRTPKEYRIRLPFIDSISQESNKHILLANIYEYFRFITDKEGKLKRYLFESNVRDFAGFNKVNNDIVDTLANNQKMDFWWLNNGITVITSGAVTIGKEITIDNVQIVNGLQTSFSIFYYFSTHPEVTSDKRNIVVKIISETDTDTIDSIIRATNNQTSINMSSLFATERFQKDIEDVLLKNGVYYERRKYFYQNQGIDDTKIFSIMQIAESILTIMHKLLVGAMSLKARCFRDEEYYKFLFNSQMDISLLPLITKFYRRVETISIKFGFNKKDNDISQKVIRDLVPFLFIARKTQKFNYSMSELKTCFDIEDDENEIKGFLEECLLIFKNNGMIGKPKPNQIFDVIKAFGNKYSIDDYKEFCAIQERHRKDFGHAYLDLTRDTLTLVENNLIENYQLPENIRIIAEKTNLKTHQVVNAIKHLVYLDKLKVRAQNTYLMLKSPMPK